MPKPMPNRRGSLSDAAELKPAVRLTPRGTWANGEGTVGPAPVFRARPIAAMLSSAERRNSREMHDHRSNIRPKGKRTRVPIEPGDEKRLLRALDSWADSGALVALRTRAFVLLLWDGSVRTSGALELNVEDVVKDPKARRPTVLKTITQRACEANDHQPRQIVLSARAQDAIADYLRGAQLRGLLTPQRLQGPLFLADVQQEKGQRLAKRSAMHSWEMFQLKQVSGCSRIYQLEDVVYTGRIKFMKAAGGDIEMLSTHTGLSRRWAAEYRHDSQLSALDVMEKLDKMG
jgi:integrase